METKVWLKIAVYADLFYYFMVNCFWWLFTSTVILPFFLVVKYNQYLRRLWFAFIYSKVAIPYFVDEVSETRKELFTMVDWEKDLPPSRSILEIGIGSGPNLPFYPKNSRLIALDINPSFERYLRSTLEKYPNITLDKVVIASADNMVDVPDNSVDIVVSTWLQCSVQNNHLVLNEVHRILKPGGKLLFLEHVSYPEGTWAWKVQKMIEPLWTVCFAGCRFKNSEKFYKAAGFSQLICRRTYANTIFYVRPLLWGVAVK